MTQVFLPWKVFGSNGFNTLDKPQPPSVVQTFTKRLNYDKKDNLNGIALEGDIKFGIHTAIVRGSVLTYINIHYHDTNTKIENYITTNKEDSHEYIHSNLFFTRIDEKILEDSALHLNHYVIQSFDWFMRVKATRGDGDCFMSDNARDANYFHSFDMSANDIDDFELARII